jgi:hypothetical protein
LERSCSQLREFTKKFPLHKRQFTFDEFNEKCYVEMYEGLRKSGVVIPRQQFFEKIHGLKDECAECWKFYMNPRNESVKFMDIKLGKQFEKALIDFFCSIGILCAQVESKENYPDVMVFDVNGNTVAYCEVKYLTAPFLTIYKKLPGRECYEGSTTLDVGKKIKAQRKIVNEKISVPVFYVYWLDYPCIKGVFYMSAERVYAYIDEVGTQWKRRERRGNFVEAEERKILIAELRKVYLPLLEMGNFEELVEELRLLIKGAS